jgi:hypothetical protein
MTQLSKTIRFPNSSICLLRLLRACCMARQHAGASGSTKERCLSGQHGPDPKGARHRPRPRGEGRPYSGSEPARPRSWILAGRLVLDLLLQNDIG